ncbi:MAG: ATP-dependent helicase HrpB [Planctomycetota bacterium]
MNELDSLPVALVMPELMNALGNGSAAVLHAPPGAGKTTLVPIGLIKAGYEGIVLIEPRRLAAKASALRIAYLQGSKIGDLIGYQVRFDSNYSSKTKCLVVTTGIILNWLSSDPYLSDCKILVFDEFHERSLESDLLLGMARLLQKTVRQDLKILVMSATLDSHKVSAYMDDCPVISCMGKMYPVEISYQVSKKDFHLEDAITSEVFNIQQKTKGDILVFLSGMYEILSSKAQLEKQFPGLDIHILHGDLPIEVQEKSLKKAPRDRVILSTNVAETSVTVNGVKAVIDSGQAKKSFFDNRLGLNSLETIRISKASADQRAGRAGREAPGFCSRLWSERDQIMREDFDKPEIHRVDLSAALLRLFAFGENNWEEFPWFEKPNRLAVDNGIKLLENLKAIHQKKITPLGLKMNEIPLHPRLSAILLKGANKSLRQVSLAIAILSERSVFSQTFDGSNFRRVQSASSSDVLDVVELLEHYQSFKNSMQSSNVIPDRAANVFRVRDQLITSFGGDKNLENTGTEEDFLRAILAGFPDRVAKRREKKDLKALMVGNRGVVQSKKSMVRDHSFFVCVDIQSGDEESIARMVSGINADWLDPVFKRTQREVLYDPGLKKLIAVQKSYYMDLVLDQKDSHLTPDDLSGEILHHGLMIHLKEVLPVFDSPAGQLLERINIYGQLFQNKNFPVIDSDSLLEPLLWLCKGKKTLPEVRDGDWFNAVRTILSHEQYVTLQKELPEKLTLPSGKIVPLKYEVGKSPLLEARIQELFGWKDTPKLGGGKLPLLISLLAPNYRSQQLTLDLAGFWKNTYPQVRKDLRGRYPKHAWPEDPLKSETEP